MKFCKDCKWFETMPYGFCSNPHCFKKERNPVSGEIFRDEKIPELAIDLRKSRKSCGPDAAWFEKKTTIIDLLKSVVAKLKTRGERK